MTKKERVYILDIPIDTLTLADLHTKIQKSIQTKTRLFISTVNASFIYKSLSNNDFKNILNSTDLNTADGVSVQLAAEYLNTCKNKKLYSFVTNFFKGLNLGFGFLFRNKKFTIIKNRITGVEITEYLLKIADQKKLSVCILNKSNGLTSSQEIEKFIKEKYPKITLNVASVVSKDDKLNIDFSSYSIVLCTLGEYSQEYLLHKYIENSVGIMCGIGSTFDVLTLKVVKVDNKYKQKGLEWFVRLVTRPKRFPKIFRSVVLFPLRVYLSSI